MCGNGALSEISGLYLLYVCSRDNFAALPSRKTYLDGKWMLNIDIFSKAMLDLNFKPDVDLFASGLNKQLDRFVSFKLDPEAIDIDAFPISWTNLKFYAFPPLVASVKVSKNHNGKGNRCYSSSKLDYSAILFCPSKNVSERPSCHKEEQTQSFDAETSQNESKIAKRSDLLICLV